MTGPATEHPYLTFGLADDAVGLIALALALVALALAWTRGEKLSSQLARVPSVWLVGGLGLTAALLSWLYIAHYLRGGPRVIDATSYWLEARTFAAGGFAFSVPEPSGSFRGRFLLPTADGRLAVIFPPGYPLALAAGFLAGAPLAVGPICAGLLVWASYFMVKNLLDDEVVARTAALVSTLCVALRYHTADTMSHGFSALLMTLALGAATKRSPAWLAGAGLAAGWLFATRPVTGAVALALSFALVARRGPRGLPWLLAGALPGLALLFVHQHAITGSWLGSTQLDYYALADGPPGCFRLGFGPDVGCRFEHGDVVKHELPNGFGPFDAARITLGRLAIHSLDVANLVPLALLVLWSGMRFRREAGVPWLALGVFGLVLSYAPFYYPGSYPGGGARFYADALPLEHGLLALGLVRLKIARFTAGAMLLGFSLHAVHAHAALAEREGGKPMFVPEIAARAPHGLVFVNTDHGFSLAHDPRITSPAEGLLFARERGDAHDLVLWERLGRPATYRYRYSPESGEVRFASHQPRSDPLRFESDPLRFEMEAEWPPLALAGGWAHPDFRPCLSAGQGLHLRPEPALAVETELTPPAAGTYAVAIGWLADPATRLTVELAGRSVALGGPSREPGPPRCERLEIGEVTLSKRGSRVRWNARQTLILDYVELTRVEAK